MTAVFDLSKMAFTDTGNFFIHKHIFLLIATKTKTYTNGFLRITKSNRYSVNHQNIELSFEVDFHQNLNATNWAIFMSLIQLLGTKHYMYLINFRNMKKHAHRLIFIQKFWVHYFFNCKVTLTSCLTQS